MDPVGLALTVVGTADLCFKYGHLLFELYKSLKGAEPEIDEKILCITTLWLKTRTQVEVIKKVEHELTADYRENHAELLQVLGVKLRAACARIEGLIKKEHTSSGEEGRVKVRRAKYAITKDQLDETIDDLRKWQDLYDPSWFLILRIESRVLDQVLPGTPDNGSSLVANAARIRDIIKPHSTKDVSVFLPGDKLVRTRSQALLYSTARFCPRPGSEDWVVIDTIPQTDMDADIVTRDIRKLAGRLRVVDAATFGILRCRGVVKTYNASKALQGFDLVLDAPVGLSHLPHSLRSCLISQQSHNLSDRFSLARQIAKATNYVHTLGFVHKNMRPENIIGFDERPAALGQYYLIGFEQIRSADGRTRRLGDSEAYKDIYRHPERQGLRPYEDYRMQHDIYSLGVCLLEIGLWTSFVVYNNGSNPQVNAVAFGLETEHLGRLLASECKDHLVSMAKSELLARMGGAYSSVVANCLTCLDTTNDDFGDRSEFEDEDGVLVGVRYIEKVLSKLNSISV